MRAVLGLALVLFGVVMGYLVITGKLPAASPNVIPPATTSTTPSGSHVHAPPGGFPSGFYSGGPIPANGSNMNSMGLPTMQHLMDIGTSRGGMI